MHIAPSLTFTNSLVIPTLLSLFLRIDNFATVNGRKVCDVSKVSEFSLEKRIKLAYLCT